MRALYSQCSLRYDLFRFFARLVKRSTLHGRVQSNRQNRSGTRGYVLTLQRIAAQALDGESSILRLPASCARNANSARIQGSGPRV